MLLTAACGGPGPAQREITEVRVVDAPSAIRWHATPAERFGLIAPGTGATGTATGENASGLHAGRAGGLAWEAPEEWSPVGPTSMRVANFLAGSQGEVECYVTIFPGDGGGLLANVNRWRGQLDLPPTDQDDLDQLERIHVLGSDQPWIQLSADAPANPDSGAAPGAMLAIAAPFDGRTAFVKMVGPRASVRRERDRFRAFCSTLRSE